MKTIYRVAGVSRGVVQNLLCYAITVLDDVDGEKSLSVCREREKNIFFSEERRNLLCMVRKSSLESGSSFCVCVCVPSNKVVVNFVIQTLKALHQPEPHTAAKNPSNTAIGRAKE